MNNKTLKTKKVISLLLSLIMAVSMMPSFEMEAFAEELSSGSCGENVTYSFDSTSGTLTISGTGDMNDYYFSGSPFYYNEEIKKIAIENGVTSIGDSTFCGCSGLTSITIPNSVTSIGGYAFCRCSGLTSITIPDSVTSIGDWAFDDCSGLTSITITNSVTRIGDSTFFGCSSLTSIKIPSGVTSIGDSAFYDCSSLTSIKIPSGVTSIGDSTFCGCSGLTSITIPSGVTSIGAYAFNWCKGLTSVTIPSSVTSIGDWAFSFCSGLASVTIPNSVMSIGNSAFWVCSGLTSITIPNSVTSIGSSVFSGCSGLTSITIPESIASIGESAFSHCSGLTSITIPNSVTSIGDSAFYDCSSLTSVTIPSSVTSICNSTFSGCSSLTSITIPESITSIGESAFSHCSGLTSITIPNSVMSIGNSAFWDCSGLTSITIPNSVTSIGDGAFYDCSSLTSITIPNSVTSIGDSAFVLCEGLTSITIPNSVTSIGSSVFSGCSGLTSITIPNSVTSIGDNAFDFCSSMTRIDVDSENEAYCSVDGVLYNKSKTKIIRFPVNNGITNYELPNSVKNIGDAAFESCRKLKSVTIPNSVTSIGNSAFYNCSGLTSVTIPNSVTSLGYRAFSGCSGLTSMTIPDSVTNIGDSAFDWCEGLTSITIPNSVTSIGDSVFNCCSSLTSITIPNSVTSIGDEAFSGCSSLTSITISNSVTSISSYAFTNCISLNTVNFNGTKQQWNSLSDSINPAKTRSGWIYVKCSDGTIIYNDESKCLVKDDVIYSADGTTLINYPEEKTDASFTIPDTVVYIDDNAFENNYLKEVVISKNVMTIGKNAFSKCPNLEVVKFATNSGLTKIKAGAFKDTSIEAVTLPANLTYIGAEAFNTKNLTYVDALGAENIKFESNCFGNKNPYLLTKENSATHSSAKSVKKKEAVFRVYDQMYTGNSIKPTVVIVIDGKTLKEGTDYRVTYDNKKNVGTGKITVIGKGKYKNVINGATVKYHIFKITSVKLSKYSFTYNGKVCRPTVTKVSINDGKGNKTLPKKYYNVTYTKGCKTVGTYNTKVTLRNGYSGSKIVTFKINPDNATKMSLSPSKKGLTVKWKKAKQASGYQIQYSTNKNFKGAKVVKVSGAKKTSRVINGLKAKKKYYVRIRTYKVVKGKTYYSSWSKAKSKKTK